MIDLSEVGAFSTFDPAGVFTVSFGLYLPGIRPQDGFDVVVRMIHVQDRFDPEVHTNDVSLTYIGGPLDLWNAKVPLQPSATSNFGQEGIYVYRYQLFWTPPNGARQVITQWFTDPFARQTDLGLLSAFQLSRAATAFTWTDATYKTPELDDLIVYELQVEEFGDTFDGVIVQLTYLQSLGVNCLELMPVTSSKVDFDWGYGPLHYFSPSHRYGDAGGLKRLIDACHAANVAVIIDVVYQHVDDFFAYHRVYADIAATPGAPSIASPMIGASGDFGPECDFSKAFTQEYFLVANKMWLDYYHVDGFRYDEVTDLYFGPTDTAYAQLSYDVYQYSTGIPRFQSNPPSYSRLIQAAEALGKARDVLSNTYTSCAWQDELLNKAEDMMTWKYADAYFAHRLDPYFNGYPASKTVVHEDSGASFDMPVAPFQYLETHDHSQLIVFAGTTGDAVLPPGNRSFYYRLQPFAIALYTAQGVPMLWQGQEFGGDYNLPSNGSARIQLRRDMHWEQFYDLYGVALIRLYRILGNLRRVHPSLRSRESFFYYQQSLQNNNGMIAYHRHAPAGSGRAEEYAMVLLNFSDNTNSIAVPFPKAGVWRELIDDDQRTLTVNVPADGAVQTITVPSHYGQVFVL
jgi:maltooligosyltrehalose trehalohydrolase